MQINIDQVRATATQSAVNCIAKMSIAEVLELRISKAAESELFTVEVPHIPMGPERSYLTKTGFLIHSDMYGRYYVSWK